MSKQKTCSFTLANGAFGQKRDSAPHIWARPGPAFAIHTAASAIPKEAGHSQIPCGNGFSSTISINTPSGPSTKKLLKWYFASGLMVSAIFTPERSIA